MGAYLDSLGWIYFKQNKLADAEATLRKAVERESHDATIRSHLAMYTPSPAARTLPRSNGRNRSRNGIIPSCGHRKRQNRGNRKKLNQDKAPRGAKI